MTAVLLWLNPGGEVRVAERSPERGHFWLPAWEKMEPEEAQSVLVQLTKAGYYGQRIYSPQVSADDPEVQALDTSVVDEAGLLLARFSIDVKRALFHLRLRERNAMDALAAQKQQEDEDYAFREEAR